MFVTEKSTDDKNTLFKLNSCLMDTQKSNIKPFKFYNPKNSISLKLWSVLRLPQPAHVISLLSSLYLGFLFYPREISKGPSTSITLLYMACFAMHFGTQFWMTFASGLVLFYRLPRHTFGQVQKILFPKYFTLNALLSAITLSIYVIYHPQYTSSTIPNELKMQTWTLSICFVSELWARVYIVPGLLSSLEERMLLEANAGVGMEIGCHKPGRLALCPRYRSINKRFRLYHAACAFANVLSMFCSIFHLYFLSVRLRPALT